MSLSTQVPAVLGANGGYARLLSKGGGAHGKGMRTGIAEGQADQYLPYPGYGNTQHGSKKKLKAGHLEMPYLYIDALNWSIHCNFFQHPHVTNVAELLTDDISIGGCQCDSRYSSDKAFLLILILFTFTAFRH